MIRTLLLTLALLSGAGLTQAQDLRPDATSVKAQGAFAKGLSAYQKQDYPEAARWYRLAAAEGHGPAMHGLAVIYEKGEGVERDYAQAFKWYLKSASHGEALGMNGLGTMYEGGRFVERDYREASLWWKRAAELGLPESMANLGWLYRAGPASLRDDTAAALWLQRAAESGSSRGKLGLVLHFKTGRGLEGANSSGIAGLAQEAEKGNRLAMSALGRFFFDGHRVGRNLKAAEKLLNQAREAGDVNAAFLAFLIALERNEAERGRAELVASAKVWKGSKWQRALLRFLLGTLKGEDLLEAASEGEIEHVKARRRCEGSFYRGALELVTGERARAKQFLEAAVATKATGSLSFESAKAMLARLK